MRQDDAKATSAEHPAVYTRLVAALLVADGRNDEAIGTLWEGIQRGEWWAPETLLLGAPEFSAAQATDAAFGEALNEIAAICDERARQANHGRVGSHALFLEAKDERRGVLVVLHTRHDTPEYAAWLWQGAPRVGYALVVPRSRRIVTSDGKLGWVELEQARADVLDQYAQLVHAHSLPEQPDVIGGFSLGGALAVRLGLEGYTRRVIALCPGPLDRLATGDDPPDPHSAAEHGLRVAMIYGEQDWTRQAVLDAHELFSSSGIPSSIEEMTGTGHNPDLAWPRRLRRALATV
jgi:predicted esterase